MSDDKLREELRSAIIEFRACKVKINTIEYHAIEIDRKLEVLEKKIDALLELRK